MGRRPRIGDVAREAGVSKTAVSFAFNQPDNLNATTRERILAVAAEIGYRPSPIARRLAARRTDQIGLVVPQSTHDIFANPFVAELVRGLGDECDEQGIAVVIVPPVRGSIARSIEAALVDGLILLGLEPDHPELELVRRGDLPIVALDVEAWDGASVIAIDDVEGARQAAAHLRELGHRDIVVLLIARHPDTPADERGGMSARRLRGVRDGLGLAQEALDGQVNEGAAALRLRVLAVSVSEEGGRDAFAALAQDLPTAIVTMSDVVAIGVLNAALDAGVQVPGRLSIIGFDDVPAASWTSPRLTTVHQPIREKGRLAARRLIDAIRSGSGRHSGTDRLPTRLVVRGSTASPPVASAG
ncbi:MAG TPA: LacI family DNA-binding transcriptional regulator [Candidatus Limnocylindria bacterium]|nr:LacI family DNA-binding transcriptional regulator [Candidatus Limnocylindria bacterium]